jgi:drug/metabolite transporter (DMT)-like permease
MSKPSRSSLLAACLAIVYVVWGSTYLAIHFVVDGMPPLASSALRNLSAGPILLAFLKWRGAPWPTLRQWRNGALVGFMMMGLGNGFVCLAETRVPSGLAALIIAGTPVFAIVFAWGLFGARPRLLEWLGVALGLAGMGLLNLDLHAAASPAFIAVLFVAGASWAAATVLQPRLDLPRGPMSAAVQMLGGGASLVVMAALHGERLDVAAVPLSSWLALAYLVVFGSIVAYTAFVYLIRHSRPALATSYAYVNPVVAVALGVLFAGETVSGPMLVGMAVILAGVGLVVFASSRRTG